MRTQKRPRNLVCWNLWSHRCFAGCAVNGKICVAEEKKYSQNAFSINIFPRSQAINLKFLLELWNENSTSTFVFSPYFFFVAHSVICFPLSVRKTWESASVIRMMTWTAACGKFIKQMLFGHSMGKTIKLFCVRIEAAKSLTLSLFSLINASAKINSSLIRIIFDSDNILNPSAKHILTVSSVAEWLNGPWNLMTPLQQLLCYLS